MDKFSEIMVVLRRENLKKHPSYLVFASRIISSPESTFLEFVEITFMNEVFFQRGSHRGDYECSV